MTRNPDSVRSRTARLTTAAFFVIGMFTTLAIYVTVAPDSADAGLERPTGVTNPTCRKPAGSCVRFFAPTPPSDEEIRENNAMCLDVVWGDPLTERELYWPHSCPTGMITQDIGL